jgi:hypothetical protein
MLKTGQVSRTLPFTIGALLILGSGVIHGVQSDRWGQSQKVLDAANKLNELPVSFNDWVSEESEIPEKQLRQAEAVGHFSRSFVHSKTGRRVSVMILCGRPGPISVHPPTVCFVGAGWRLQSQPASAPIDGNVSGSLWNGQFARVIDGVPVAIQTFWGWSSDGVWLACNNPRFETASFPFLYKMYVTVPVSAETNDLDLKTADEFMGDFLPRVNHVLFEKTNGS